MFTSRDVLMREMRSMPLQKEATDKIKQDISMTSEAQAELLIRWLSTNAFFNVDDVQLDTSGPRLKALPLQENEDNQVIESFTIQVVPKNNVLSYKNGCIINLLEDFDSLYESEDAAVILELSGDIPRLLLTVIYEMSAGEESPWFHYFQSINLEQFHLPICLWRDEFKKALANTKYDLLDQMGDQNLVQLYEACRQFALVNSQFVEVPKVLSEESLKLFSQILSFVLKISVFVDDYHGYSIIPGAELFMNNEWHVEFEGTSEVCGECGEEECDHDEGDMVNDVVVCDLGDLDTGVECVEDSEDKGINNGEEVKESEESEEEYTDGNITLVDISDEEKADDWELESSEDELEEDSAHSVDGSNIDSSVTSEIESDNEPEVIDLEYIEKMEKDLEMEENDDEEGEEGEGGEEDKENSDELSELELSGDEEDLTAEQEAQQDELQKQLSSEQCISINCVAYVPGEQFVENDQEKEQLSGYYGYVYSTDVSECILTVPFFKHLNHYGRARRELADIKLEWFQEVGFELIKDIVAAHASHEQKTGCDDDCDEEDDGHEHEGCCGEDSGCSDHCDDADDNEGEIDGPASWELSITAEEDGNPSIYTYAVLKLMLMPFNLFFSKFVKCKSESKLIKRVVNRLLPNADVPEALRPRMKRDEVEILKIFRQWCQFSLERYKRVELKGVSWEKSVVELVVEQEKAILEAGRDS